MHLARQQRGAAGAAIAAAALELHVMAVALQGLQHAFAGMGCSTPSRVCTWGLALRRRGGGMQGRVQGGGGVTHGRRSPASWSASRGRLASQLEVTQIVGVHFTVDLTHQIGAHFHFLGRHLHVVGGEPGVDPGMGFCLVPAKAGCRPTAAMRRLVMYSTYWQRMSLFRPIVEPSWNRYSAHPSPAGPLP